jgi:hypothetical protein
MENIGQPHQTRERATICLEDPRHLPSVAVSSAWTPPVAPNATSSVQMAVTFGVRTIVETLQARVKP